MLSRFIVSQMQVQASAVLASILLTILLAIAFAPVSPVAASPAVADSVKAVRPAFPSTPT